MKLFMKYSEKTRRATAIVLAAVLVLANALTCFAQTEALPLDGMDIQATSLEALAEAFGEIPMEIAIDGATDSEAEGTKDAALATGSSVTHATDSEGIYRTQEEIDTIVDELLARGEYEEGEAIIVAYKDADIDEIIGSVQVFQEVSSEVAEVLLQDVTAEESASDGNDESTSASVTDIVTLTDEDGETYVIPADGKLEDDVTEDKIAETNESQAVVEGAQIIEASSADDEADYDDDMSYDEMFGYAEDDDATDDDSSDDETAWDYGGYTPEEYAAFLASLEETEEALEEISEDAVMDAQIGYVSRKDMTTREILTQLLKNPKVISAEPNYLHEADEYEDDYEDGYEEEYEDAEEDVTEGVSSTTTLINGGHTGDVPDMTEYQWAYKHKGDDERLFSMTYNRWETLGSNMGIANWNDASKANATGYVAVMDTGVDVNHPDLKDVMADLSAYKGKPGIGGGDNGINTGSKTESAAKVMDYGGHGTHVAGIMAAEWNGKGVSGAANGVKIIAVKAANEKKKFSSKAILEGITYLINLQKAITADGKPGIRAVNCSFGGDGSMSAAETLAYYNLGKTGVVTVCSAGNLHTNVDKGVHTSAKYNANPYVLTVGAIDICGRKAKFSNYGYIVDVFAPGVDILSTVPVNGVERDYLPEFDTTRVAYEAFTTTDAAYQSGSYKGTKATTGKLANGTRVGTIKEKLGYDYEGGCLEIKVSELKENKGYLKAFLKVPIEKNSSPDYIGLKEYQNFGSDEYTPVVNVAMKKKGNTGTGIMWSQDFKLKGRTSINTSDLTVRGEKAATAGYEVATDSGYLYLAIKFKKGKNPSSNAYIRLDSIGAGKNSVPYGYAQGTSMAAPAATGALSILYSELYAQKYGDGAGKTPAASMTQEDHAALAKEAVDSIKHCVILPPAGRKTGKNLKPEAKIWQFCSSGGMVNLSAENAGSPVLKSATLSQIDAGGKKKYKVTLKGEYLDCREGYSGDLSVWLYDFRDEKYHELTIDSADETEIVVDVTSEISIAGNPESELTCIYPGVNYFVLMYGNENKPEFQSITGLRLDYNANRYNLFELSYEIPYPEDWETGKFVDASGQEELWTAGHQERTMVSCGGEAYILTCSTHEGGNGYCNFYKSDSTTGKVTRMSAAAGYPGKAEGRHLTNASMACDGNIIYAYGFSANNKGTGNNRIYSFDTASPEKGWTRLKIDTTLPKGASMTVLDGKIYLIGNYTVSKENNIKVYKYPVDNVYVITKGKDQWELEVDGSIPYKNSSKLGFQNPKVAAGGGKIYVSRGEYRTGFKKDGSYTKYFDPYIYEYTPGNGSSKGTRKALHLSKDLGFKNADDVQFGLAYGAGKFWIVGCSGTSDNEYLPADDTFSFDFATKKLEALGKNAGASYIPCCLAAVSSDGVNVRLFALGDTYYEQPDATKSEPAVAQVFLRSTIVSQIPPALAPSKTKGLFASSLLNVGNGQDEPDEDHTLLVNFDLNGGMCGEKTGPLGAYYKVGDSFGELPQPIAATGSNATFGGWYTEYGAMTEETEYGTITYDEWGTEVTADTEVDGDLIYDGITLYATWSEAFNYYTVVYYAENEGAYAYYFGEDDDPDYEDDDWLYDEDDCEDDEYDEADFDEDDFTVIYTCTVAGTAGDKTNIHPYDYQEGFYCAFDPNEDQQVIESDNSTLVEVVYMRNNYLVVYEVVNGDEDEDWAYEYIEFEDTVLEPYDLFRKPEYVCEGWYTDEECTQKYDIDAPVEGDLNLYGKWVYTGHYTAPSSGSSASVAAAYPDYVSTSGAWTVVGGKWQYGGAKGWNAIADKTWKKDAKEGDYSWFMFDEKGNMLTGWYTDADGKRYFLNPKEGTGLGVMLTGWVKIGDTYYYFCTRTGDGHQKGELLKTQKEAPVVPGIIPEYQ